MKLVQGSVYIDIFWYWWRKGWKKSPIHKFCKNIWERKIEKKQKILKHFFFKNQIQTFSRGVFWAYWNLRNKNLVQQKFLSTKNQKELNFLKKDVNSSVERNCNIQYTLINEIKIRFQTINFVSFQRNDRNTDVPREYRNETSLMGSPRQSYKDYRQITEIKLWKSNKIST